jgi:hypothetical protein
MPTSAYRATIAKAQQLAQGPMTEVFRSSLKPHFKHCRVWRYLVGGVIDSHRSLHGSA